MEWMADMWRKSLGESGEWRRTFEGFERTKSSGKSSEETSERKREGTDGPMQSTIAWITEELLDQRLQDCPQRLAEPTPAGAMLELGDLGHNLCKALLQQDESTCRPPLTLEVTPPHSSRGLNDQARPLPLS